MTQELTNDTAICILDCTFPVEKDCGASWAIIGHSERRELFGETNEVTAAHLRHRETVANLVEVARRVLVPVQKSRLAWCHVEMVFVSG